MRYMQFYVKNCDRDDVSGLLFQVLLKNSDAFSLIYFRYNVKNKMGQSTRKIKTAMASYKLSSGYVTEWPGTRLFGDQRGQIYRMEVYRADLKLLPLFEQVKILWEWDYPKYPMDPCFYRDGYAWFVTTSHECINTMYVKKSEYVPFVTQLEYLGLELEPEGSVDESELFHLDYKLR